MTIDEFKATLWTGGMKATCNGKDYDIITVDFEEFIIGIDEEGSGIDSCYISWKRCENIDRVFVPET